MLELSNVEEAIKDIREGKMIIVIDNPDRENEGDLLMAADKVNEEDINFMAKYARGLICMPISQDIAERLDFQPMVQNNTDNHGTAFTVSIDHKETTTGISSRERALTIQKVIDTTSIKEDFRRPGHIFPLIAKKGGVLSRAGHTESCVDLAKMAGLKPAGVICEIMNEDGTMARTPELIEFSKKHNLKVITVESIIEYRMMTEKLVSREVETKMPTKYGDFKIYGYIDEVTGEHHIALVKGDVTGEDAVLTRVHSECLTGDCLGSKRCDCGEQYEVAMRMIEKEERGILVYMRQEGRGIGLINKLKAYALQDTGVDTVDANLKLGFPADMRNYSAASQILKDLGVTKIKLITNNPSKIWGINKWGIEVEKRVPIEIKCNENNKFYLKTKKEKMHHILNY